MNNQKGFTLIELIVVIVILGILSAVAVPKFVDMQVDARQSSINALAGAVRSAVALAHSQALVKGKNVAALSGESISMEDQTITLVYGYPATVDIGKAISADGFTYTTATGVFSMDGYSGTGDCTVTYAQSTTPTAPPTVTVDDTCQ
jgi:MSHA pilin protein MshA